jgi:hypothetical protein
MTATSLTQFLKNIRFAFGCWLWTGRIGQTGGYGQFGAKGRYSHRISYELFRGKIPDGLTLDHLCRVRRCVNPFHLEPVTGLENTKRGFGNGMLNARKTECKNGHPFDQENTRVGLNHRKKPRRFCRACIRIASAKWKHKMTA